MQATKINFIDRLVIALRELDLLREATSITQNFAPTPDAQFEEAWRHYRRRMGGQVSDATWQTYHRIIDAARINEDFRNAAFPPDFPRFNSTEIFKVGYMNTYIDNGIACESGLYNAGAVANYIDDYCDLCEDAAILDFGCGSMRVSRFLVQFAPQFKWSACDVNPFSVEWAKDAFGDRANIFRSDSRPPLPIEDQSFDLVFAWSIFSHYSEPLQKVWLEELHRTLRSGGYLLLSYQSDHLLSRMHSEDMVAATRSENVDLHALSSEYAKTGFGYYKCYPETAADFGFDPENFGMAFISPSYIDRSWTRLFEVVRRDSGGVLGNFQDVVLLRKPR